MWLGLQTVYLFERCPLFRVSFKERFHCTDGHEGRGNAFPSFRADGKRKAKCYHHREGNAVPPPQRGERNATTTERGTQCHHHREGNAVPPPQRGERSATTTERGMQCHHHREGNMAQKLQLTILVNRTPPICRPFIHDVMVINGRRTGRSGS